MNNSSCLSLPDANVGRVLRSSLRPHGPVSRRQTVCESFPSMHTPDLPSSSGSFHGAASGAHRPSSVQDFFIKSHEQVSALIETGRSIGSQFTRCLGAVAAQWTPVSTTRWSLPLAPRLNFSTRPAAVAASPALGVLGQAASPFILLDGQVAAAVPPLPAAAEPSPTLLPFLVPADQVEVKYAALLADLSNMAYGVGEGHVTVERLQRTHNLNLVSSYMACMLPERAAASGPRAEAASAPANVASAEDAAPHEAAGVHHQPHTVNHHHHHSSHHHAHPHHHHGGGADAFVLAAAASGVAAAAAAASDAPPPVLLLPSEAEEATAAAASASPVSSPLMRSPRTSFTGADHQHSPGSPWPSSPRASSPLAHHHTAPSPTDHHAPHHGAADSVAAHPHQHQPHQYHPGLLSPLDSLLPHGVDDAGSTHPVSFVDLSCPAAAMSTLSGCALPGPAVFLTGDWASLATYSEDVSDPLPHRMPVDVHYLPGAHVHVATQQLPDHAAELHGGSSSATVRQDIADLTHASATASSVWTHHSDSSTAFSTVDEGSVMTQGDAAQLPAANASLVVDGAEAFAAAGAGGEEEEDEPAMCEPEAPTAWFVCDDPITQIRHFVLQGSTSWEHWQINMQVDPVVFEDPALGVRVHRGVYETANLLYDDLLPLVRQHLASSPFAKISFTGHSLGGSLAAVLMLLLVRRGEVKPGAVSPVYTFGAPAVFCQGAVEQDSDPAVAAKRCSSCGLHCELAGPAARHSHADAEPHQNRFAGLSNNSYTGGAMAALSSLHHMGMPGQGSASSSGHSGASAGSAIDGSVCPHATGLLQALNLSEEHVVNVIMHKDIVPRAFVCDYSMVADLVKRWWPSFQDHSSLQPGDHQSLYAFVGRVAVLQPPEHCSFVLNDGHHEMLPHMAALYKLYEELPPGYRRWDDLFRRRSGRRPSRSLYEDLVELSHAADDFLMHGGAVGGGGGGSALQDEAPSPPRSLKEALTTFINTPHPLTVLADYRSYGGNGTISRYHNPDNYARGLEALLEVA